jgi:DNA adenine methylase
MKYMGSKARIAKEILPIILADRKPEQWYVEPFVGGCNAIAEVSGNRIGADKNKYLIAMWKGLQENRDRPHQIPKELYDRARNEYNLGIEKEFDLFEIGWIGWMASFNGRFFDGGYSGKASGRDYVSEQIRNTEKQIGSISGIQFHHSSYETLEIPSNSIIYCDIPYKGTKQYITSKDFDHEKFWNWCRDMANQGHRVFVSEYSAPDGFQCLWEKEVTNSLNTSKTYRPIEKLFLK